jgi:ABC-type phosphate transport system substrate-binding protein
MAVAVLLLFSCNTSVDESNKSDWKKGKAVIAADENLHPLLLQFKQIFENEYPEAQIDFNFQANDSIINAFVRGSYTSGIITRSMSAGEINNSGIAHQHKIKERVFAFSGIALIANNAFPDSVVDLSQVPVYLQNASAEIIFDNASSGIARHLMQLLKLSSAEIKKAKSVGSAESVIDYVRIKNNAIGFIPYSSISDLDNKKVVSTLNSIKLMDVKWNDTTYSISQQAIAKEHYPLWQPLNFLLSGNQEPVAEAFMNFLQKGKASKMLLKAGLVPANMPIREYIIIDTLPVSN